MLNNKTNKYDYFPTPGKTLFSSDRKKNYCKIFPKNYRNKL